MEKYRKAKAQGALPEQIAWFARKDGLSQIEQLKIVKELFDLSFVELKSAVLQANGTTLDEHYERIANDPLKLVEDESDDITSDDSEIG